VVRPARALTHARVPAPVPPPAPAAATGRSGQQEAYRSRS
jgi:hypothetical protein